MRLYVIFFSLFRGILEQYPEIAYNNLSVNPDLLTKHNQLPVSLDSTKPVHLKQHH
jgi:hypothetical protein